MPLFNFVQFWRWFKSIGTWYQRSKICGCFLLIAGITTSLYGAAPLINEIGWMGTDHRAYDEWIELYNPSEVDIDITGWRLFSADGTPDILLQGVIVSDGFFVLERTDDTVLSRVAEQVYTGSLNNTGEKILLQDINGVIVDATPAGKWLGGINSKPKQSLERIKAFVGDGNDVVNWDTSRNISTVLDFGGNFVGGSPGSYNSISPPKPRAVKLFSPTDFSFEVLKLSPTTLGSTKEWLSFLITSSSAIDLTDWSIRRGRTTKKIGDIAAQLQWKPQDFLSQNVSGKIIDFIKYPEDRFILLPAKKATSDRYLQGVVYMSPSLFSLPDSGGLVEIFDDSGKVVSKFLYPKTKKGSRSGQRYSEIWQQDLSGEIVPVVAWETDDIPLLQASKQSSYPTFPENTDIVISEVSLSNGDEADFIELYVVDAPDNGANIKDLELSQNGTNVLHIPNDYWVKKGEFIVIYFGVKSLSIDPSAHVFVGTGKKSLARSNGTLTLKLWTGTSWEVIEDFWCWLKPVSSISTSMLARIDKASGNIDTCFSLENPSIEAMSWAKDFSTEITINEATPHKHYLGSAGSTNYWPNPKNVRPNASIGIQTITDHSINVTGEKSYDQNGDFDLARTAWSLLWKKLGTTDQRDFLSEKLNPAGFYIDRLSKFTQELCEQVELSLTLKLWDFHSKSGKNSINLPLSWQGDVCSLKPITRSKVVPVERKFLAKNKKEVAGTTDFFAEYEVIIKKAYTQESSKMFIHATDLKSARTAVTARDKFFAKYPQITPQLLSKNIGWAVYLSR